MNTPNLLIIYPYFYPAKKAGGIASSLYNLVGILSNFNIFVYTSCYDLDGSIIDVTAQNEWINYSDNCKVLYANRDFSPNFNDICQVHSINTVYINGLYGLNYAIKPLWQLKKWRCEGNNKLIVAPRGMVQKNSLKIKPLKKSIYFTIMKCIGVFKNISFHVTEPQEQQDTIEFFKTQNVILVKDCPNTHLKYLSKTVHPSSKPVRLLFLSLLARMKNIAFLLSVLEQIRDTNITLHIYGPIKDDAYWNDCQSIIATQPNVKYCGEVTPTEVTQKMNEYDYFVLPTLGENFGHVIFESLVAGTPVIISDKTSWQNVDESQVGWVIPLEEQLWLERLESLAAIKNEEYMEMSANCHRYISNYLAENNPVKEYEALFG